jgi:hypothetical protein
MSEPLIKRYVYDVAPGSAGVSGEGRSEYDPCQVYHHFLFVVLS